MIKSLRGVGYSLETAVADLIDNSITACASQVSLNLAWNEGNPVAAIFDDGVGMTEAKLVEAMRFGGGGPDTERTVNDLGRFGLGLKTASFSQCRQLTVVSKTHSDQTAFTWDIDYLADMGSNWQLIEGDEGLPLDLRAILNGSSAGTLVVWRKIDFGRKDDFPSHASFKRDLERLDHHLGMVFHRFLDGDAPRLSILLNGSPVKAWDPFLEAYSIPTPIQPIPSPGGRILFRGFILPYQDRFATKEEFDRAGGPNGWLSQQGFYVYRQKRLIYFGGWLGLGPSRSWTRDEASKLARIRIDIPNSADRDWRIDIKKSEARPPDAIRPRLQQLAEDVRRRAREILVHRGDYGRRSATSEVSKIWKINAENSDRRYSIDRTHELVATLRKRLSGDRQSLLDSILDVIERTVPVERVWLDVTEKGVKPVLLDEAASVRSALELVHVLEKNGFAFSDAITAVQKMDPYEGIQGLREKLLQLDRFKK
ncbi:ATP-binding protein [Tardiphaga robiniae]|uniref:ATP-binding protein n=1 Tax=Tardiphaga robiniae TaxID=943830 RepID=UPI0013014397|nr:ATP-binding protein [Tardiphaga robiniae]